MTNNFDASAPAPQRYGPPPPPHPPAAQPIPAPRKPRRLAWIFAAAAALLVAAVVAVFVVAGASGTPLTEDVCGKIDDSHLQSMHLDGKLSGELKGDVLYCNGVTDTAVVSVTVSESSDVADAKTRYIEQVKKDHEYGNGDPRTLGGDGWDDAQISSTSTPPGGAMEVRKGTLVVTVGMGSPGSAEQASPEAIEADLMLLTKSTMKAVPR